MIERGKVVRVEDGTAYVLFKRSSACGNCKACGMLKDMSEVIVDVPNTEHAQIGDRVTVAFSSGNALGSSAIAYIFPLIFLIIGVFVGYNISNGMDGFSAGRHLGRNIRPCVYGTGLWHYPSA